MSLIQGGQLQLPKRIRTVSSSSGPHSTPLPYLGAVGTIPLSVPTGAIHHHPSSGPTRPGSASGDH